MLVKNIILNWEKQHNQGIHQLNTTLLFQFIYQSLQNHLREQKIFIELSEIFDTSEYPIIHTLIYDLLNKHYLKDFAFDSFNHEFIDLYKDGCWLINDTYYIKYFPHLTIQEYKEINPTKDTQTDYFLNNKIKNNFIELNPYESHLRINNLTQNNEYFSKNIKVVAM